MNRNVIVKASVITGALIGIGLLQFYIRKIKAPKVNQPATEDVSMNSKETPSKTVAEVKTSVVQKRISDSKTSIFPLQQGSKGDEVTQLQMYLLKHHGWSDVVMGTYDLATQKRVLQFLKVSEITEKMYQKLITKPIQLK